MLHSRIRVLEPSPFSNLKGANTPDSGSGGREFVVVDEAAEAVESLDWACAGLPWRVWWSEAEPAVGTLAVVVVEVLADDVGEVALVSDQDPVEALAADRPDEPLGIGIRDRRSDWSQNRADQAPDPPPRPTTGPIERRDRLGRPIHEYERTAA